ncbi:Uncharacterised protein [Mycobacteroides abscessus subsp. abscessus]|nr:Uncharacterised protein [Mycobacteroides abscessus subsp. abscessus]
MAAPASFSPSISGAAVPAGPATTAEGSPRTRAAVMSSALTFFSAPSECSTSTSTSAISILVTLSFGY